jgi:hypothetical protein
LAISRIHFEKFQALVLADVWKSISLLVGFGYTKAMQVMEFRQGICQENLWHHH